MSRKVVQKIKNHIENILLGDSSVKKNNLFHPRIYPDFTMDFKTTGSSPFILRLGKPYSVLDIDKFLIQFDNNGYDINEIDNTEYDVSELQIQDINSDSEYFHTYQFPVLPVGRYAVRWGFRDILGNEIWRNDNLVVE